MILVFDTNAVHNSYTLDHPLFSILAFFENDLGSFFYMEC